ncbi:hypothetical protein FHX81_0478 [Saccharothrix saharensis]|uniref:Uncharacterized protein n=1 Tax=Saccharothrix saharensis TaxID=571190 RepID=A0A543J607_9PSEU|nr:hypothetical protein [Saccharothrix saharensis]TQM78218.1 hypothetical protein FHX81_0478 [Saccharothrix saharensis]
MDLSPESVLRMVLIWAVAMLALSGLSERRTRRLLLGMLYRRVFPLLLVGLFAVVVFLVPDRFPQWWDRWWRYVVPLSTVLLGLALWLRQQGQRLIWSGYWEFRDPTPEPEIGVEGLTRPPITRLRVLGYMMMLVGLALTAVPTLVLQRRDITPDWVEPNGFLIGVAGVFTILYGGKTLKLARTRRARELSSRPIRGNAWSGSLLWVAAWLCCLAGLVLTLGGLSVMMDPRDLAWWQTFLTLWTMILGGAVFTQGRKAFLRARRHRTRFIPDHRHLRAGSYVLYLRSFEEDERHTALHEVPLPGLTGGAMFGFLVSGRSAEEHVAEILRPVGPLVAVGAPGERLPHMGAVRLYLPYEGWQEPVRELMRGSRLTVLTLGTSEGTMWELAEAFRLLSPQRLVLFIPNLGDADYRRIRASVPRLPECPVWLATGHRTVIQGVIHFAADWTPSIVPVVDDHGDATSNLFTAMMPALLPAFTALGEYEKETGADRL